MKFMCACGQKELNIPDEKLPEAKRFAIKCPYCQKKMVVDRHNDNTATATFAEPQKTQAPAGPKRETLKLPAIEPEVFPPGAKVAFIDLHNDAWRPKAEALFKQEGYEISVSEDPLEAVAKLRLNHYDVLVVEDCEDCKLILGEVASWSGHRRRTLNYIMVGPDGKSMHPDVAFERGVNFYLNSGEADKAEQLLKSALEGYELYYQLFTIAQKRINE